MAAGGELQRDVFDGEGEDRAIVAQSAQALTCPRQSIVMN
jgi:hypothetical protein